MTTARSVVAYGECHRLARQASPKAVARLIEMIESDDERVAAVACNAVLDRAWGKPRVYVPENTPQKSLDFSLLSHNELETFARLLERASVDRSAGDSDP